MKRKKYIISFAQAWKAEKLFKNLFLKHADMLRLTRSEWIEYKIGFPRLITKQHYGHDADPHFQDSMKAFKPYFLRKIRNNMRFNDIPQPNNQQFTHYFFRLSQKIKDMVNDESLYFYPGTGGPNYSKHFYGFEDPTFYKSEQMIGSVIGHEPIVTLFLIDSEKKQLGKQGVKFDTFWKD